MVATMNYLKYLIIGCVLTSSAIYAEEKQGIKVKTDAKVNGRTRIVRMTLGDNREAPVINIGPQGPVVLVFPGNISRCHMSNSAFSWEISDSTVSGKDEVFKEVAFNLSLADLSEEDLAVLKKEPAAAVCKHEDLGQSYYREILLRLNEVNPHRVVFFEYPDKANTDVTIYNLKDLQYVKVVNGEFQPINASSLGWKSGSVKKYKIKDGKWLEKETKK
jgi:hypothetical protein